MVMTEIKAEMDSFENEKRTRITGLQVPQFKGRSVCLLGIASSPDATGMSFKLQTTDNKMIQIQLTEPLQEFLEGYLEVYGSVTQKNTIACCNYVSLPTEMMTNFDAETYNETVSLQQTLLPED